MREIQLTPHCTEEETEALEVGCLSRVTAGRDKGQTRRQTVWPRARAPSLSASTLFHSLGLTSPLSSPLQRLDFCPQQRKPRSLTSPSEPRLGLLRPSRQTRTAQTSSEAGRGPVTGPGLQVAPSSLPSRPVICQHQSHARPGRPSPSRDIQSPLNPNTICANRRPPVTSLIRGRKKTQQASDYNVVCDTIIFRQHRIT